MITRSNLAEQLREYQIRSKHEWATISFFSSTASNASSRTLLFRWTNGHCMVSGLTSPLTGLMCGVCICGAYMSGLKKKIHYITPENFHRADVILVIWELLMFAFLVFSGVALYFRYMKLVFVLICVTLLMLVCMKVTKQVKKNRKSRRRMLLPLSM